MNDANESHALSIRDLHVYYGAAHILQGIDITVSTGIHAVLGRNGMGKTTLCNAIMGLVPVRSGSIRFEGQELIGKRPDQIAKLGVGYTPQGRMLWPSLTVDEHLKLSATKNSPWTPERIYDTFPRLAERRRNGGAQLSGGEQQMVAIARALMPNPRLLIMDEPTEGLAPVIVRHVEDMLKTVVADGNVSILLVEQNVAVPTEVADDIAIMVNGRIASVESAERLKADRDLQQRLLGVGRAASETEVPTAPPKHEARPAPADEQSMETDTRVETEAEADNVVVLEKRAPHTPTKQPTFVDPPRWSSDNWKKGLPTEAGRFGVSPGSNVAPIFGKDEKLVLVAGTFDTKLAELTYIRDRLRKHNIRVKTLDLSTSGKTSIADIPPHHVAVHHPGGAAAVFTNDRGTSVSAMAEAFVAWVQATDGIAGIISAAGSGGTALATPAMRALPVGIPKMMVSTVASGDISEYIGVSDIMMMYSITDIQGINRISSKVLANAADALAGAVSLAQPPVAGVGERPLVGLTSTDLTMSVAEGVCQRLGQDFASIHFEADGIGSRSMESLVDAGKIAVVADLTLSDIANRLIGGLCAANDDRLNAISRTKIPYVGSVAGLDTVVFGASESIPEEFLDRHFFAQSPRRTLMRISIPEATHIGNWIADQLNSMSGPVRMLLPAGGLSALDAPGQPFWNRNTNEALFTAIRDRTIQTDLRRVETVNKHAHSPEFADAIARSIREITNSGKVGYRVST